MSLIKNIFKSLPLFIAFNTFSQNVNEFTGSLNHGIPLMNVPSNKGGGVNISASYNAGIGVKQPASEIGLGWQLNAGGAIYRSVFGLPDDGFNMDVFDSKTKNFNQQNGILYGGGDAEIYRTSRNMDSLEFMFPEYDDYQVSGPGIGGRMTPFIMDYEMFTKDDNYDKRFFKDPTYYGKTRSPQFHFNGDFADTLVSRHYSVTPISGSTPFTLPNQTISGLYYNNDEPYLGKSITGSSITAQNYDPSTMRLASSNYIEYFRNSRIDSISINNLAGFINYQTSCTRNSSDFPSNGIGAFRITTSAGYVYHYSLPVYIIRTENHNYPLENDYNVPTYDLSAYTNNPNDQYYTWTQNTEIVTKHKINNKYAYQWLLTAITGPDYEDSNNNHIVDVADKGYWVYFDYKKWSGDFAVRSPHYGFDYYFGFDDNSKTLPASQPLTGTNYKLTGKSGIVNLTIKQVYHLSKIQTSSHTAIFVRETRNDEVSGHGATSLTSSITPTPILSTKRIILFKNDAFDSIPAPNSTITFGWGLNDFYTTNGSGYFYGENWYTTYANTIKNRILKHVEFSQDYSLCRKYQGNVHAKSLNTSVVSSPSTVQSNLSVQTYSLSGKLTLNKITIYDFTNVKTLPSTVFDYNVSVSNDNPDYDPRKIDYWGFYKSDITANGYSGYTSHISKDYTDAWSLRKITEPLGAVSEFEYESNSYSKVLDNKASTGYRGASFIFPFKSIALAANPRDLDITLEEGSATPNEFLPLISGTITGLSKKMCLPLSITPIDPKYPDNYYHISHLFFGNCSFTGTVSPLNFTNVERSGHQYSGNANCYDDGGFTINFRPGEGDGVYGYEGSGYGGAEMTYAGYGYLHFEMPSTYEVYGGGIRVRKIKTKNNDNEIYVTEYQYENGVASMEADRFEYPGLKKGCGVSNGFMPRLTPISFDKHSLGYGIGYGKVTVKNKGRSNTANGSVVNEYINSNPISGSTKTDDFKMLHFYSTNSGDLRNLFECIDKFSPFWGLTRESKVLDVNNNIVSRTVYEYENTEQGAIVENFVFRNSVTDDYYSNVDNVCILRHYPVVLKKTKNYGMGSYTESEVLKRDEITGETSLMRSIGQNASSSLISKVPAFRISTYANMGPKSINASYKNILSPEAYSYSTIDTTISTNGFANAIAMTYTNQSNVLTYNGNYPFSVQTNTLNYWKSWLSASWTGTVGSINEYGLHKRSELNSNPYNFSNPLGSSAYWRLSTETTLSDEVGHALESRDFNNRFNSIKFGYNNYYLNSSCSNANYSSFTYANFESIKPNTGGTTVDGEVLLPTSNGSLTTTTAHTGYRSLCLGTGSTSWYQLKVGNNGSYETGIERGRIYRVIVWVSTSSPNNASLNVTLDGKISGVPYSQTYTMYANDASAITVGNWKRLSLEFKLPDNFEDNSNSANVKVYLIGGSSNSYFDDLIFYPVEASFKGNVYHTGNGRVIAEINQLGYATFYTYDAAGRILEINQEIPGSGIKLIKRNSYNFANTN